MSSSGPAPSVVTPPQPLIAAVRRLLRPLIRLLLSYSVQYPYLASLLKLTYVEVATQGFSLKDKELSDSRITLLTGIHRQDVKRLRSEIVSDAPPPASVSLGAQLVAKWTGMPEYLDSRGKPRPLARHASEGGDLSFERLVQSISKDFRPRVVLDEWLRLGVAKMDKEGRVILVTEAFVPSGGLEEKLFYFGKNIHDHLAASTHNVLEINPPMLDRCVYYDHLSPDSVLQLEAQARVLATKALTELNAKAMALQEADAGSNDAKYRINFGAYFYRGNEDEPPHS
jgi:hypothetical protein